MKENDLLEFLSSECSTDKDTVLCVLASLGQTIEACFLDCEPVEVPGVGKFCIEGCGDIKFNPDEYIVMAAKNNINPD